MNKALALVLFLFASNTYAWQGDDPYEAFDATNLMASKSTISWRRADDVTAACDAESRRLGLGGFNKKVLACSFQTTSECTIITGKTTTMHSLGHEARHCFQGSWHK